MGRCSLCGEVDGNHAKCCQLHRPEVTVTEPFKEPHIRTFESGATRDTAEGKLDYSRGLCPHVLTRYMEYLDKHREQSNGEMREWDNWKQGIPKDVYMASLLRHVWELWSIKEGEVIDNDILCAIMFNSMGMLHEILKES